MAFYDRLSSDAWLWLTGSLLLAVFWTNLAWLFSPWIKAGRSRDDFGSLAERVVVGVATWRFAPPTLEALRLLYYVGVPFAALFWGRDAVVGRLFGLQRFVLPHGTQQNALISANWFDWMRDLGWAAGLGFAVWGVLRLAGLARRRAVNATETVNAPGKQVHGWEIFREATYREIHWAFYRNAPIAALGLYWGTWAGLALVGIEALADPIWRTGLSDPGRAPRHLLRAALAVVSSVLFLRTQNLWLALVLHAMVAWGLQDIHTASLDRMPEGMPVEN